MADNISDAFTALQARWDAIFTQEQARFATVNQDLPMTVTDAVEASRENFREAVAALTDDRYMRDAVHDPAWRAMMAAREESQSTAQTREQGMEY